MKAHLKNQGRLYQKEVTFDLHINLYAYVSPYVNTHMYMHIHTTHITYIQTHTRWIIGKDEREESQVNNTDQIFNKIIEKKITKVREDILM